MTVYYVDPIGGNNSNNGTSFANRWKNINSARGANLSDGDEVRCIKSPDPTSLGNGTWKGVATDGTVDIGGWNDSQYTITKGSTTTFNTNSAHNKSTGDVIQIQENYHTSRPNLAGLWKITVVDSDTFTIPLDSSGYTDWDPTSSSQRPYISHGYENCMVKLATTDLVKTFAFNDDVGRRDIWTGSDTNVTTSWDSYIYAGTIGLGNNIQQQKIVPNADFTTGKVCYFTLPATVDLSAYEQLSFSFATDYNGGYDYGTNYGEVRFCSDALGATAVHTVPIPDSGGRDCRVSMNIVKDFGTALGNNINSIGFYINTDQDDEHNVWLGNFMACKDSSDPDAITMSSVITKDSSATVAPLHYELSGIFFNGQYLGLAGHSGYGRKLRLEEGHSRYYGTSETVTTYHWRPTLLAGTDVYQPGFYGYWFYFDRSATAAANGITISGGWDTTNMSSRTGMTAITGPAIYSGICFGTQYTQNITFKNFITSNFYQTYQNYGEGYMEIDNCSMYGSQYGLVSLNGSGGNTIKNCKLGHDYGQFQTSYGADTVVDNCFYDNAQSNSYTSGKCTWNDCTFLGHNGHQTNWLTNELYYNNCFFDRCKGEVMDTGGNNQGVAHFTDCTFNALTGNAATYFMGQSTGDSNFPTLAQQDGMKATFTNYNDVTSDHRTAWNYGLLTSETSIRHTASGFAWKLSPLHTNYDADKPLGLKLATIYCNASAAVTATVWVRRTNTGLTSKLVALASENASISTDVTDAASASADTWEQLSITFTPSSAGAVIFRVIAYGGSTYSVYIDDFAISQA
tara:strand:+ start:319 stop:2706 length:2388 start_codon:yes stop_codon:yes gene_type:complete